MRSMSLVVELIDLVTKHKSGELRCPATALIKVANYLQDIDIRHYCRSHIRSNINNEPPHEKTNNMHMRKQIADQLRSYREADQRLCFCYTVSRIPLLSKSKISKL